jgi:hypothetical protein
MIMKELVPPKDPMKSKSPGTAEIVLHVFSMEEMGPCNVLQEPLKVVNHVVPWNWT